MKQRSVVRVVPAAHALEGGGFEVNRPFPQSTVDQVDPFLMLDEMGPQHYEPGQAVGAPDHPHRGFETVTYVLAGEFEHRDSYGNHGVMRAGDVQWMTAGSGVVHSEMPGESIVRHGGRVHGFQLWVNLPAAAKRTPPRYQALASADIPTVRHDGVAVRVISGQYAGSTGPGQTHSPITYLHVSAEAGRTATVELAGSPNAFTYVFDGNAALGAGGTAVSSQEMALWGTEPGAITIEAGDTGVEALVLAGEPLGEPVARYGPFVMNTRDEIIEAVEDFSAGRMGSIEPTGSA